MTESLELIEKRLLPEGCHFSDEQQAVIFEDDSMDVVAGPGTGKTTVLTARIKILLEQIKESRKGICVLTHTNVAVDEIKESLKKLGVDEIKNPHFIGTIQDFFNTFFAKKAFHLILGDKKMRVLDDDVFREKFDKQFEFRKPDFYREDWNFPNPGNWEIKWDFDNIDQAAMMVEQKSYNKAFNESISYLFKQGIITNKCCLELAKWYIEQYQEILKAIISKRFSYLLLDEVQDTSKLQFSLISSLFDNQNLIIQRFGDPFQAIYNIWDDDIDLAWKIDHSIEKRISKTSRFSDSIVDVVKNVCIEKYDDFISSSNHTSLSPYFIVYEDGDNLISKFSSLIEILEMQNDSFKKSLKDKVIVSAQHRDLENTFGERYQRVTVKNTNVKNEFALFSSTLLKSLSKNFDDDFEDSLNKDEYRIMALNIIKELRNDNDEKIIDELSELLNGLIIDKESLQTNDDLCFEIKELLKSNFSNYAQSTSDLPVYNKGEDIRLGTIHSVKGETHKATLLMLDSEFSTGYGNSSTSYSMLQLLEKYLTKNYVELSKDKSEMEKEIEKALKLAYVALSRPTHLVCIGIPEYKFRENSKLLKNTLKVAGWVEF
ncbi:UvrD-helicase domain-containing protein [Streptococcus uberis]|uniref:UvrD-helicase domain-containing protein n=1 Tax=Streptococcus uberis TaxID=1349 RepID=UPI0019393FEB|nr:UvrD-helicase domain-containing protein [Streptococcus uberis]